MPTQRHVCFLQGWPYGYTKLQQHSLSLPFTPLSVLSFCRILVPLRCSARVRVGTGACGRLPKHSARLLILSFPCAFRLPSSGRGFDWRRLLRRTCRRRRRRRCRRPRPSWRRPAWFGLVALHRHRQELPRRWWSMIPPLVGIGKRLPSPRRSSGRFVGRLILAATMSFDRLTGAASGTARRDATMEAGGISSGHRRAPGPARSDAPGIHLGLWWRRPTASLSSVTALRVTLMRVALVGPWVEPGPPTKEALLPFDKVDDQRWDRTFPSFPRPDRAVDEHAPPHPHVPRRPALEQVRHKWDDDSLARTEGWTRYGFWGGLHGRAQFALRPKRGTCTLLEFCQARCERALVV